MDIRMFGCSDVRTFRRSVVWRDRRTDGNSPLYSYQLDSNRAVALYELMIVIKESLCCAFSGAGRSLKGAGNALTWKRQERPLTEPRPYDMSTYGHALSTSASMSTYRHLQFNLTFRTDMEAEGMAET